MDFPVQLNKTRQPANLFSQAADFGFVDAWRQKLVMIRIRSGEMRWILLSLHWIGFYPQRYNLTPQVVHDDHIASNPKLKWHVVFLPATGSRPNVLGSAISGHLEQ